MVDEMVTDVMRGVDATATAVIQAGGAKVMDATDVTHAKVKVANPEDVLMVATSTGAV